MTLWLPTLLAAAVLVLAALAFTARRRAVAREAVRVQTRARLAERLEASLHEIRTPKVPSTEPTVRPPRGVAPLVAERLPGRAALLEAVADEVARARAGRARLTVALVRIAGDATSPALFDAVRDATGRPAYAVGPSAAAFTLPGLGRAEGLAAVARIESRTASGGRAVEWQPDETAAELIARLLVEPRPGE
jgi:hypothetical protein